MNNQIITKDIFIKKMSDLCLRSGMVYLPNNNKSRYILFKSMLMMIGTKDSYSEKEINEHLKEWIDKVGNIEEIDYVTLRRLLVDEGYLARDNAGQSYTVVNNNRLEIEFEPEIDEINVIKMLQVEKEKMEQRKQAYMNKQRGEK